MSTRMMAGGRPPVVRDAIYAVILSRPGDGLTASDLVKIVGCKHDAARDACMKLRARGLVFWLQRGCGMLHFGTAEARDAYAASRPAYQCRQDASAPDLMAARREAILSFVRSGPAAGVAAMEIAAAAGASAQIISHMLHDLVRCGEIVSYGHQKRLRWFPSQDAADAGKPIIDAMDEARLAEIVSKKTKNGQRSAVVQKSKAQPVAVNKAARTEADKRAQAARQARAPAAIVGMDKARRTEAVQHPPHRFWVDPRTHTGEFSALGPGRYIDAA